MLIVSLILGLILPTLSGWFLVRLIEWTGKVLFPYERLAMACLLGLTLTMFLSFFGNILLGIPLNLMGELSVQVLLTCALGTLWFMKRKTVLGVETTVLPRATTPLSRATLVILLLLGIWTLSKILVGAYELANVPVYLDDTIKNWDFRGKVIYVEQHYRTDDAFLQGIGSYPPTVPMSKAWIADVAGHWSDGVADIIHIVWFLCALTLLFALLRRHTSFLLACIGTYALANLPLYLIHGTNPYAEVFVSGHLLVAMGALYSALRADSLPTRLAWLRLSGFAAALLTFTKNEGFALYLPVIVVLLVLTLVLFRKHSSLSLRDIQRTLLWWVGCFMIITLPWIAFKMSHHLVFGNAHAVSGLSIVWQQGVVQAIIINTFFEGNWIFLFPLLITLLIWKRREAFSSPLLVLTTFILVTIALQCGIFLFTPLSNEALYQTGFARGFTQLMPVVVLLCVLLIREVVEGRRK